MAGARRCVATLPARARSTRIAAGIRAAVSGATAARHASAVDTRLGRRAAARTAPLGRRAVLTAGAAEALARAVYAGRPVGARDAIA